MKELETKIYRQKIYNNTIKIHTALTQFRNLESNYNDMIKNDLGTKEERNNALKFMFDYLQVVIDSNTAIVESVIKLSELLKKASR